MNYQDWKSEVPDQIKNDPLWTMKSYRLSLFIADLCWIDCSNLFNDPRLKPLAGQLYRAIGSIGANIAEGYSRNSGRDQARFYEYALGSVRESQDWYYKARHRLSQEVVRHRLGVLTEIKKLLLATVSRQRERGMKEPAIEYHTAQNAFTPEMVDDTHPMPESLLEIPE